MSRENKVNPGTYTQAGRLSQDDAAREMKKQREAASPRNTEGGDYADTQRAREDKPDLADDAADADDKDEEETKS